MGKLKDLQIPEDMYRQCINYGFEWDELTPMATACYNFFPNCNARESAFFVMFGRDPINKLNMLYIQQGDIFMTIMDFPI